MSQQGDVLEQSGPNQVVHIRSDSETKLDELFNAVIYPKDYQVPLTVPMRLRNLPPSFFKQPENGSKSANHSRESSLDGGTSTVPVAPPPIPSNKSGLLINHPRAHSSPATLQQAFNSNTSQHQHLRQQSFDLLDDSPALPPGWEKAKAPSGQIYYLNHLTQTTTWIDPRKKASVETLNSTENGSTNTTNNNNTNATSNVQQSLNLQNLGSLPKGWQQASTMQGEIYFINHIDRSTTWLDPRIPAHLQNPPVIQTPALNAQRQTPSAAQLPSPSISLTSALSTSKTPIVGNGNVSLQQKQQQLRLQRLQMERERLKLRQQEIIRQTACLGNPLGNQELLLRQSLAEELNLPTSPLSTDLPSISLDSFLDGVTDFHSRQESADSGLGLGSNYSLPNTPEDFLSNMDDVDTDCQTTDLELDLQTSLDLGDENMDSDDLIPSLQEELNADILSDVEAMLASNEDSVLTWL